MFSRIHGRLCDSLNKTADMETKAGTDAAAADHFMDTWVHVHTRAAQHTVMPSQCFDTGSLGPSLVLVRDVVLTPSP